MLGCKGFDCIDCFIVDCFIVDYYILIIEIFIKLNITLAMQKNDAILYKSA